MEVDVYGIFIEFLEVSFHYLLFLCNIYPKEIFEDRKKYGISVKCSIHPNVNFYLTNCLKSISEVLSSGTLEKVVFRIIDRDKRETCRFIFDPLDVSGEESSNDDHYLIKCEQNLRSFFLKMVNCDIFRRFDSENRTFDVLIYTTESTAVNLTKKPELEKFPLIECENDIKCVQNDHILPIHTINIGLFKAQVYVEFPSD